VVSNKQYDTVKTGVSGAFDSSDIKVVIKVDEIEHATLALTVIEGIKDMINSHEESKDA